MLLKGFFHIHCILLPIQIKKIKIRIPENLWSLFKFLLFPHSSAGKESTCNVGDLGSIPGLWRSPGEGHGNPPQYSCLGNSHGQRSLAGYSPWGCKVGHYWATKHSTAHNQLTTNAVIVLGEQRRDSPIHIYVSILPQIPFPFRLPLSRAPWQPFYFSSWTFRIYTHTVFLLSISTGFRDINNEKKLNLTYTFSNLGRKGRNNFYPWELLPVFFQIQLCLRAKKTKEY